MLFHCDQSSLVLVLVFAASLTQATACEPVADSPSPESASVAMTVVAQAKPKLVLSGVDEDLIWKLDDRSFKVRERATDELLQKLRKQIAATSPQHRAIQTYQQIQKEIAAIEAELLR